LSFGSPNKNIGDAFLLVWKLKGVKESNIKTFLDNNIDVDYRSQIVKKSYTNNPILFKGDTYNSKLAEHALISYLKIIVRLINQENI
jgi:class 3 adenylate cyclase